MFSGFIFWYTHMHFIFSVQNVHTGKKIGHKKFHQYFSQITCHWRNFKTSLLWKLRSLFSLPLPVLPTIMNILTNKMQRLLLISFLATCLPIYITFLYIPCVLSSNQPITYLLRWPGFLPLQANTRNFSSYWAQISIFFFFPFFPPFSLLNLKSFSIGLS